MWVSAAVQRGGPIVLLCICSTRSCMSSSERKCIHTTDGPLKRPVSVDGQFVNYQEISATSDGASVVLLSTCSYGTTSKTSCSLNHFFMG